MGKGAYLSSEPAGDLQRPEPPQSLLDHAQAIGADLWRFGRDFNYQGDRQQWAYAGRHTRRASLPYPALRGANQLLNASGALAALEALARPTSGVATGGAARSADSAASRAIPGAAR